MFMNISKLLIRLSCIIVNEVLFYCNWNLFSFDKFTYQFRFRWDAILLLGPKTDVHFLRRVVSVQLLAQLAPRHVTVFRGLRFFVVLQSVVVHFPPKGNVKYYYSPKKVTVTHITTRWLKTLCIFAGCCTRYL